MAPLVGRAEPKVDGQVPCEAPFLILAVPLPGMSLVGVGALAFLDAEATANLTCLERRHQRKSIPKKFGIPITRPIPPVRDPNLGMVVCKMFDSR